MDQLLLVKVCKLVKLRKKKTKDFFVLLPYPRGINADLFV
jgi:hypothetical protein